MAAITTAKAGNWSDTTVWTGGVLPTSADDATLAHSIVWDVSFTVKTLTINAGMNQTTSGTGLTFGFAAAATINQGNCNVTIGAGNAVAGVQGSPFVWTVGNAAAPGTTTWLSFNGTTGSHCAASDGRFTYDGVRAGTGISRAAFTDFLRCGDATNPAMRPNQQAVGGPFTVYDCNFDACGALANPVSLLPADTFDVRRCVWKNTPATVPPIYITCAASQALTTGVRRVDSCVFDLTPKFFTPKDLTVVDCVFAVLWSTTVGRWAQFARNLCYPGATGTGVTFPILGDDTDCFYLHTSPSNPHYLIIDASIGNQTSDGAIFECATAGADGDCYNIPSPAALATYTLRRAIKLPNSSGLSSGTLFSALGNANARIVCDHNTCHLGGAIDSSGGRIGETFTAAGGMPANFVTSCRGNAFWDTTARGFKLGGLASGTVATDAVTADNADYNGGYNFAAGTNGNGYTNLAFSAGTPGAHDVSGDPQFVDSTRDFASWSTSLGGAGTFADVLAQFQARNPAYTVANLIAYIRAGFVPQAATYKNASYPGDPLMPDLGALAVVPAGGGGGGPVADYTLTGPSGGLVGVASSPFTVTLGAGTLAGTVVVTPTDSGGGGTFTPTSVSLTDSARSGTFAYTAASAGTKSISTSDNGGLADPAAVPYAATVPTPGGGSRLGSGEMLAIIAAGGTIMMPRGREVAFVSEVAAAVAELAAPYNTVRKLTSAEMLAVISAGGVVLLPSGRLVRAASEVAAAVAELG